MVFIIKLVRYQLALVCNAVVEATHVWFERRRQAFQPVVPEKHFFVFPLGNNLQFFMKQLLREEPALKDNFHLYRQDHPKSA